MKTTLRLVLFAILAVLPTTSVFGYWYYVEEYLNNTPISEGGSAATDAFVDCAQLSPTEVEDAFAPSTESAGTPTQGSEGSPALTGLEFGAGDFEVGALEASLYTIKIPYSKRLNERATLQLSVPLTMAIYKDAVFTLSGLEDAQAYGFGLNVGYAWQKFLKSDNVPYRWKITPSAGLYYRDSSDLNLGSFVTNIGLSSSFAWQFSPGWVLNMGNSISTAWNSGIKGYPDPIRDDQQTLVNGLQLYRLLDRWTVNVYFTHTQSLSDIVVDSFQTYGFSAGYKLTQKRSLRLTLLTEEGNGGYKSVRGTLGTTWQF